jgi:hypothetical protein
MRRRMALALLFTLSAPSAAGAPGICIRFDPRVEYDAMKKLVADEHRDRHQFGTPIGIAVYLRWLPCRQSSIELDGTPPQRHFPVLNHYNLGFFS